MKKWLTQITIIIAVMTLFVMGLFFQTVSPKFWPKLKSAILTNYSRENCSNCNLLLIDLDVLRADSLPCYGYFRNTAPNLCAMAAKSAVLTDNYSASIWTLPSSFSTITGLYPTFHGVKTEFIDNLSADTITLPEVLQQAGYKTIFVSDKPYDLVLPSSKNNGSRGFDLYTNESLDQVLTDLSASTQPWFIYYYSSSLHAPYILPENIQPMEKMAKPENLPIYKSELDILLKNYLRQNYQKVFKPKAISEYKDIILGPTDETDFAIVKLFNRISESENQIEYTYKGWEPFFNIYNNAFDRKNVAETAYVKMIYDTKIQVLDSELENIFFRLKKPDFAQKTVTIITSDHGEAFGEHGTFFHDQNFHTELFYTPLIINGPNIKPSRLNQTSSNIDIFPTILDILNLPKISSLQGISLLPYITGEKETFERFVFSETFEGPVIQNSQWLYLLPTLDATIEETQLFDKKSDPAEIFDVKENYPLIAKQLYLKMDVFRSYDKSFLPVENQTTKSNPNLTQEKIQLLKKEGYF